MRRGIEFAIAHPSDGAFALVYAFLVALWLSRGDYLPAIFTYVIFEFVIATLAKMRGHHGDESE